MYRIEEKIEENTENCMNSVQQFMSNCMSSVQHFCADVEGLREHARSKALVHAVVCGY